MSDETKEYIGKLEQEITELKKINKVLDSDNKKLQRELKNSLHKQKLYQDLQWLLPQDKK